MKQAAQDCERLRSAIPSELVVDKGELFNTGDTIYLKGKSSRLVLIVKMGEKFDRIWLYSDGSLAVGIHIHALLNGQIDGFEYLAGRWPWPGAYGPPDPQDPLGRHS
jgi:hypothetical protein